MSDRIHVVRVHTPYDEGLNDELVVCGDMRTAEIVAQEFRDKRGGEWTQNAVARERQPDVLVEWESSDSLWDHEYHPKARYIEIGTDLFRKGGGA